MVAAAISFTACNDDSSQFVNPETSQTPDFELSRATFPEDDGSPVVPGNTLPENVARLLMNVNAVEATDTLGRANITSAQYAEIKAFADKLVEGTTTQYDAFIKCYEWVILQTSKMQKDGRLEEFLFDVRGCCMDLLEKSELLCTCSEDEVIILLDRITLITEHMGYVKTALSTIEDNKEGEYVRGLFDKLKTSGFLYHPTKQFCVTTYLNLPAWLSIIAAMVVCTLLGILIEGLAYKPLRGTPSLAVLITAIGVSYFLQNGAQLIWGSAPKNFTSIVKMAPIVLANGRLVITGEVIVTVLASILVMLAYVEHTYLSFPSGIIGLFLYATMLKESPA